MSSSAQLAIPSGRESPATHLRMGLRPTTRQRGCPRFPPTRELEGWVDSGRPMHALLLCFPPYTKGQEHEHLNHPIDFEAHLSHNARGWRGWRDSNPRVFPDEKSGAFPLSYTHVVFCLLNEVSNASAQRWNF